MPVNVAHDVHKKRDPRSDFEKKLEEADGEARLVLACPFGCGTADHPELDEFGYCDHLVGFTNCQRPDRSPTHASDGVVKKPEGAMIELIGTERDALKRRKFSGRREPLLAGDYLVRVNGTSRRVYREVSGVRTPDSGVKDEDKKTVVPTPDAGRQTPDVAKKSKTADAPAG